MATAPDSDAKALETAYRILNALVDTRQERRRRQKDDELTVADIAIDYGRNVIAAKLRQSHPEPAWSLTRLRGRTL